MEKLTDKKISSIASGLEKDLSVVDQSGMTVLFRVGAKRTTIHFYFRTSKGGKPYKIKIGTFPALSVAEAREEFLKMMGRVERGLPAKEEEVEEVTLESLFTEWFARKCEGLQEGTKDIYRSVWKIYLKPFARLPISLINTQWVDNKLYAQIADGVSRFSLIRTGTVLTRMMEYASAKGYVPFNPLSNLKAIAPKHTVTHHASFDEEQLEEEMKGFFATAYKNLNKDEFGTFSLFFLSLLRSNELFNLTKDKIVKEEGYSYAIIKTKTWTEFKAPFVPQAEEVISYFKAKRTVTARLLTSSVGPMASRTIQHRLDELGYKGRLTLHGIRSCGRQWMAQQDNIKESTAELCLAHTIGDQTERAYNRGNYLEKRLAAMRQWGDFVESCLPDGLTFKTIFASER